VSPITLSNIWDGLKQDIAKIRTGQTMALLSLIGTLGALGFGAYLSSLVFPLIVSTLVAFTSHGIAVFAALAACALLVWYTMKVVNAVVSFIIPTSKPVPGAPKKVETNDYIQDVVNEFHAIFNAAIVQSLPGLIAAKATDSEGKPLSQDTRPKDIALSGFPGAEQLEALRSDPYLQPGSGPVAEDADALLQGAQAEGSESQSVQPVPAQAIHGQPIHRLRVVVPQQAPGHSHGAQNQHNLQLN